LSPEATATLRAASSIAVYFSDFTVHGSVDLNESKKYENDQAIKAI